MGTHSLKLRPLDKSVFRAYDIRGIIGKQLDADAFYSIGKAIAVRLHDLSRDRIFLAQDGRLTSQALAKALSYGLQESGIHILDLGPVPTPVMYYATHTNDVDSGLMVTGSHNPGEYNGIKMVLAGTTLANADIQTLFEINQSGNHLTGEGSYQKYAILEDYFERIVQDVGLYRPLKVVVDCGNGIGGPIIPKVLEQLGCEVIPLYCDVDGNFPNHHPDPAVEENLIDLKDAVKAHQADIGLAFDGDADRLGIITNEGEIIWPDRLMMLYVKDVLKSNPGATIVYDVKCSSHLSQEIEKAGGRAQMCPTGHSIVKGIMKRENAALAGEMSGHIFFKDRWFGFDDALYSACRLLETLSQSLLSASEQFKNVPNSINTPEIKIPIQEDKKFAFIEDFIKQSSFPGARIISIDGLRVEFSYGWGLVRASNTTSCIVARFEAQDEQSLEQIQSFFRHQLQALDLNLAVPF